MDFVLLGFREERNKKSQAVLKYKGVFSTLYLYHARRRVKLSKTPLAYHGFEAERWLLPLTEEQADEMGVEYLKRYRQHIQKRYPNVPLLLSAALKRRLEGGGGEAESKSRVGIRSSLLLNFPELFEQAVGRYRIPCKDMHMVVVDSGRNATPYLLELFVSHLNYLTILTERPDYFLPVAKRAYEDTGLVVEVVELHSGEEVVGDTVIDFWEGESYYYKSIKGVKWVFDLAHNGKKRQWIRRQFGNIPILDEVSLYLGGERVEDVVFLEEVLNVCFPLLRLLDERVGTLHYGEFQYISDKMKMEAKWEKYIN